MSGSGFVDKNLFGLKDKIRSYQNEKNTKDSNSVDANNKNLSTEASSLENGKKIKSDTIENSFAKHKPDSSQKETKTTSSNNSAPSNEITVNKMEVKSTVPVKGKLDKEYLKALAERKEEFIHKRSDLIKRIKLNLNKLPNDIQKYEKSLTESRSAQRKLEFILNKVNALNEKEWDKYDYTLELAEAIRVIENSRLELFAFQQNTDCLVEENIPGLQKENTGSLMPELTSLSFGQIFKMGIGFFLPLIIGILLASGIITFGMFIAMGII